MTRPMARMTMCALIAALPGLVCAAVLQNPGFEQGLDGWSTWYARQPTTVEIVPGETGNCLRMLGREGSRVVVSQAVAAAPQQWYRVRYRYRAEPGDLTRSHGVGGGAMGYCRITFFDQNGRFLDYPSTRPMLDGFGTWTEAEQTFLTPLSIGEVSIGFNQSGPADLRIDDVSIEEIPPPAPQPNTWDELAQRREEPIVFSSWQYTNSAEHFRQMGMKYGWSYRYLEQFDELWESRTSPMWGSESAIDEMARHGVQPTIYLYHGAKQYRDAHYAGEPPADIPYILDPVWHDGYVEACRAALERWGRSPGIACIFVQDESMGRYKSAILPKAERVSELWARLNEEVRRDFGGGQFGLPEGPDDENVFRWIAYYRWVGHQWAGTFARLRAVIDESGCRTRLLGPDEVGILMPLPWCDLAASVDVFTGQCLCSRGSAQEYVAGFTTKYSADLTGKPVHNATQIVKYSGSPSPEEVQRQYSLVLQSGGDGEMLIGVEWFDRELNHHRYSAPARWETIKRCLQTMSEYRVRTPPESRVAILYSSPSGMAQRAAFTSNEHSAIYALLGPKLGGWPTFVDTYALEQGKSSLDGFDVAIWPYGQYETREAFAQTEAFVRGGSTLICCDPLALRTDIMGQPLPAEALLGLRASETGRRRSMALGWPAAMRERVYDGRCHVLEPGEGVEVIATWEDGSAAATSHPLGEGRVITFGANPLASLTVSEDPDWQAWWRAVLDEHGIARDLPIWRLRLPDEVLVQAQAPADVCITGNSFVRVQNGAYLGANDPVPGRYHMSVAPDLSPESAGPGTVPFYEGDLTDRVEATKGPFDNSGLATTPYAEADWANRWSAAAMADGLTIEFALLEARDLTRLRLWYSGTLPALTVDGLSDGRRRRLAAAEASAVGPDVEELELPLAGGCDRVRLRLAPSDAELAIADIELWARPRG